MFTVYLLKSLSAKKSYVGVTNDLERRLSEHNSCKHPYSTKYAPWTVLYKEEFEEFQEARAREKYLKSTNGRRFLKKVFEQYKTQT